MQVTDHWVEAQHENVPVLSSYKTKDGVSTLPPHDDSMGGHNTRSSGAKSTREDWEHSKDWHRTIEEEDPWAKSRRTSGKGKGSNASWTGWQDKSTGHSSSNQGAWDNWQPSEEPEEQPTHPQGDNKWKQYDKKGWKSSSWEDSSTATGWEEGGSQTGSSSKWGKSSKGYSSRWGSGW